MFKVAALVVSTLNLVMGAMWFFNPKAVLVLWGIQETSPGLVAEHRLGIMIFILSLILLMARNAEPSPTRTAISCGVIAGALALAAMSAYDLSYSGTSSGVVPGISFNLFCAIAFALIEWRAHRDRKEPQ